MFLDTPKMAISLMLLVVVATAAPPGFNNPPAPLNVSNWRNKRVMAIGAHPDDIEYFAGGTIAMLKELDLNVTVRNLVVTNGNAGGQCYNRSTGEMQPESYNCEAEELAFLRRQEMIAAGAALGTDTVWRCGFNDGMLISVHESDVRGRIAAYVRAFEPHIILTHYPYPNFEASQTCNGMCQQDPTRWDDLGYHPDHKRVGLHVLNTCYGSGGAADNNKLFGDLYTAAGLQKWQAEELYFFALTQSQPITHFQPLTESALAAKGRALAEHRSQYQAPPTDAIMWTASTVAKEAQVSNIHQWVEAFQGFF